MAEQTAEVLGSLRRLIQTAKAVPMSASCMVNRAEALALIDRAVAAYALDQAEAQKASEGSAATLARAREEAAQIIRSAEDKAVHLVSRAPVLTEARRKASLVEQHAVSEAEALRREADTYVDSRIAAFEAGLQKTLTQVQTMRAKLSSRSALDGESQAPPRQGP